MRKFLLYSSALALLSGTAEAGCIQTPSCSSLGYSSTIACEGGLKCPWGNAWFCNVGGGGSSNPEYTNCNVGDILYSDKSCSKAVIDGKTPIGVVFEDTYKLAIALETSKEIWAASDFDIPSLYNFSSSSVKSDWEGKSNTRIVLEYCRTNRKSCPAFEYVYSYRTAGTKVGDWYLPAIGELNAIYENFDVLNKTLVQIGGTELPKFEYHWSSNEQSETQAFFQIFSVGVIYPDGRKSGSHYVRPVLAF